jgi:hypothetical protein
MPYRSKTSQTGSGKPVPVTAGQRLFARLRQPEQCGGVSIVILPGASDGPAKGEAGKRKAESTQP